MTPLSPTPPPPPDDDTAAAPVSAAEQPRSTTGEGGGVRASTVEREATVARLHNALSEGRLDLSETDTRVAAAYATTYRHELPPLLADLPTADDNGFGTRSTAPSWTDLWTAAVWRTTTMLRPDMALEAPSRRQSRVAALIVVALLCWMLLCAVVGAAVVGS